MFELHVCFDLVHCSSMLALLLYFSAFGRSARYASRMTKSFEQSELRTGPLGAKYNLGLLPKDRHKVPKFVNYWTPKGAQVSDPAYGYLIVTEGENFIRFHSDIDESLDSLATLYGSGEKIWFFVRPGKFAQKLADEFVTPDSMMRCLVEHGSSMACCTQEVGDTVYLSYSWVHCVVTRAMCPVVRRSSPLG